MNLYCLSVHNSIFYCYFSRAVLLFVVGVPEPNTPDQRWLERHISDINPRIRVVYKTFPQLQEAKLNEGKALIM